MSGTVVDGPYTPTAADRANSAVLASIGELVPEVSRALLALDAAVGGRLYTIQLLTGWRVPDEASFVPEDDTFERYITKLAELRMAVPPEADSCITALAALVEERLTEEVERCLAG